MNCYSCNGGLNHMQGKDLPLPPTTTGGGPTDGNVPKSGATSVTLPSGPSMSNSSSGKSGDAYAGKGGF